MTEEYGQVLKSNVIGSEFCFPRSPVNDGRLNVLTKWTATFESVASLCMLPSYFFLLTVIHCRRRNRGDELLSTWWTTFVTFSTTNVDYKRNEIRLLLSDLS